MKELLESTGSNVINVQYSDTNNALHEFMLDIVVWDRTDGEGLTLAVECEWTQTVEAVTADFKKLLVVEAPTKLMIFACNKSPVTFSSSTVWKEISKCFLSYRDHRKDERYLFMDYALPPGRKAWWIEIPSDDILEAIPEPVWVDFD